jgi:hypothetical protein
MAMPKVVAKKQTPTFLQVRQVHFPDVIEVGFAVCTKQCGRAGFLVLGNGLNSCERCGTMRKVLFTWKYRKAPGEPKVHIDEDVAPDGLIFEDGKVFPPGSA